ncbi:LmbU family transcriptional regulator [Streptomyces sp. NPDC014882]|uniref:LmbU family transcriptional regulator n=1 Tax=Streptomyces sp. NPDC014882 TaxID=3364927 RepID=UPI0036F5CF75
MRTASGRRVRPGDTAGEPAQREVVLPLVGDQARMQKSGMTFPRNLSERSWERIGTGLRELTNSSAWWLADWLIFGEAAYGLRRYREAIERTGLDYQTLRNYAWVARRFEHHRRWDSLSFAHHAEVTRLSPPEQDHWLRRAEQQMWSRNELRRALRAGLAEQCHRGDVLPAGGDGRQEAPRPAGPAGADGRRRKVATLTIELPVGQLDRYAEVAAAHGLPVDKWVAQVLEAADRRGA